MAVASATSFFLGSDLGLGLNLDLGELNNETRLLGTFAFLLLLFSSENCKGKLICLQYDVKEIQLLHSEISWVMGLIWLAKLVLSDF